MGVAFGYLLLTDQARGEVDEARVEDHGQDLSEESDGLLLKALGVTCQPGRVEGEGDGEMSSA